MPLDPSLIVAAAAPFLVKGAESFSKAAGEKMAGKVAEICRTIETKFKGDSYAEETLARAKDKPESEERQAALKGVLAEKMEEDADFAEEVTKLVEEALKEGRGQTHSVFDQSGQTVHGNQTNISGGVQGPVLSGTFSGPVNTTTCSRNLSKPSTSPGRGSEELAALLCSQTFSLGGVGNTAMNVGAIWLANRRLRLRLMVSDELI